MAKKDWSLPGYEGKPSPIKAANTFMFVLIVLLLIGFIRVGIREKWFEPITNALFVQSLQKE